MTSTVVESIISPTAVVPAEVTSTKDASVATFSAATITMSLADLTNPPDTLGDTEDIEIDVVDNVDTNCSALSTEANPLASSTATISPVIQSRSLITVNFDYGGPPITITNADPDNDMEPPSTTLTKTVTTVATTDPEAAVVFEPPSVAFTVPNSVSTLNTNAILNVETMLNTETDANEDQQPYSSMSIPPTQDAYLPLGYSKTDSVIEDILRKAASEFEAASVSSSSVPLFASKVRLSRKKYDKAAATAIVTSVASPIQVTLPLQPLSTNSNVEQLARINASVESVIQKIQLNVAFEEDFNPMIPAPNQQIVLPIDPPSSTSQTFYMVQDDHVFPLRPSSQAVSVPVTQPIQIASQQVQITPQSSHQLPLPVIQASVKTPAPSPTKKPRITKKIKETQSTAVKQAQLAANGFSSPVSQSSISGSALSANHSGVVYRGLPPAALQQVVLMQPSQTRQPTYQQIPISYASVPASSGTQYIYTGNFNEYLYQGQSIVSPNGNVTKVVTLQPGMQIPPGATFVTQPCQSPAPTYTQIVSAQSSPQQPHTQYIIQHQPPAAPSTRTLIPTPVAAQVSAPTPVPAPASAQQTTSIPTPVVNDLSKTSEPSISVTPKRRYKVVKKLDALINCGNSKFEDLDPSTQTFTQSGKPAKKTKAESPKKENEKKDLEKNESVAKKEPAKNPIVTKEPKGKKGTDKKVDESTARLKELAALRNAGSYETQNLNEEILLLLKVYSQEKSRGYSNKRRHEKLEEDYNRLFDRMQQTELSLAMHMSSCEKLKRDVKNLQEENCHLRFAHGVPQRVPTPELNTSSRALRASRRHGFPVAPPVNLPSKTREHTPPLRVPSPTPEAAKKKKETSDDTDMTPCSSKSVRTVATVKSSTTNPSTSVFLCRKRRLTCSQSPVEEASPDSGVDAPVAELESEQNKKPLHNGVNRRTAASKRVRYF